MVVHLLNNVFLLAFFDSSRAAVPSHMFLFYAVLAFPGFGVGSRIQIVKIYA
jgi:hypothetical protein